MRVYQTSIKAVFSCLMLGAFFIPSTALHAAESGEVVITSSSGSELRRFSPFAGQPIGSLATGDLGSDKVEEIVFGSGSGTAPTVSIHRQDGSMITSFLAYNSTFMGGVNVAVCDVDGDGRREIVTGAQLSGGPHVRIFNTDGSVKSSGFFAYADSFRGGVNVACADLDHDGTAEIITGAGVTGGPHIRLFDYRGTLLAEIFNGSAAENVGVYVSAENGLILAANMAGSDTTISSFSFDGNELATTSNTTSQTRDSLITTATLNDGAIVTADIQSELYSDTSPKSILVDISEQRLYAYEYGMQVNTFLISSGVYGYDTPYGEFSVLAKVPVVDYIGVGYSYPNTPWNLRFKPHYYIHTAYWHNNFGHRMSHGCVNMRESEAKWMYDWANVNTPVKIVP